MPASSQRVLVAVVAALLAWAAPPAAASARIDKTVTVRPAPHGGMRPDGSFEAGQSVQPTTVTLPASAADCEWSLADLRTGRMPGDPFAGQQWRLVFAGLEQPRRWTLIVRVLNFSAHATREAPRHWRLTLRCRTSPRPPACFMHPLRAPDPHDYIVLGFHCRHASTGFRVALPAGYSVRGIVGADNSLLHEQVECQSLGRILNCRGRTPANTTTSVGFFVSKPVRRGLPLSLAVPGVGSARARTRTVATRF